MAQTWNEVKNKVKATGQFYSPAANTSWSQVKQNVAKESEERTARIAEQNKEPTFVERVSNTFNGWKDRALSNYAGTAENLLEIAKLGSSNTSLQNKQASQAEENAVNYRKMLDRGTWDNGQALTVDDRKWLEDRIADSEQDAGIYRQANEKIHQPISNVISNVEAYGDEKAQASEEALAYAKKGANRVGQIAVDVGTIAGDVASDALLNAMVPGLGTASRVTRMYGQGAESAEDKGFGLGEQFLYGAGTAGLGEATNRLLNNNPILEKAYGKGALDDILLPSLNKTKGGMIVKGGLGEAIEEGLENVGDKGLQAVLFGDKRDKLDWNEVGYDALLASIIGAGTSAVSSKPQNTAEESSATQIKANEGSNAPKANVAQNANMSDSGANAKPAENNGLGADNSATNTVGAAEAGFTTPDSKSEVKTSRLADTTMGYNAVEGEATGMDAEQYAQLLKYKTLTEKMATQQADDMLYVEQDGQRKFIRDVDETAYQDIVDWLNMAPAWDAPMTDAAHMIRNELKGRAVNGEITQEEYVAWLESMREHATASGQGVQAHAKWSRTDNRGGAATELEAKHALERSKLPPEEQARIFRQIVEWDSEIEAVKPGDTESLKAIIMRAARERGVVNGLFGKFFSNRAESALDALTFEQLKQFAYSSTAALANDSTPADAGRKAKTIQVLNMLSKPTTPARNLTGNTTFYGLDALAMNGASLIDMAVSKLTGTRSVAAEGLPDLSAAAKAMQMAIAEITLDVDMGGETTRYGTGSNRTFKMGGTGAFNTNAKVDKFVERILSSLERNQAYLLTATDEFYKGAARATESNTQQLIDSGKIKTDDKEYAKKQADNLAKVRTFQDNSKISAAIQDIHDVLNLIGFGDSGKTIKGRTVHSAGLGDIVAPFTKVAGNLVSRGVEYSPLNAAKGAAEIAKQVAAAGQGNVDAAKQAQGVSDLARGMTGTAIAYGFMQLVKAGLMRQADDEGDKDVAALNQSEGVRGTQLNLSAAKRAWSGGSAEWQYGDTLVDLSSVEPLNFLMNLGAEMAKEPKNPLLSSFGASVTAIGKAASELPVLENVGDFVKDVAVYKTDWKEALGEMAADTVISSVVPNVVSGIAAGMDDRTRNVYTGDGLWDYIQDSFKNKIPGLRETLPGSTNSLGEAKTYQGSQDSLLASMLSPVGINAYAQGNVSAEMERVREATGGDASFYPESAIPKKLSHDGKETVLTYDQRQKYQNVRGTTQTAVTDAMMNTKAYKDASAVNQAALLNRCKDYAQQTAKASILGEKSVDKWVLNAKSAERDLKMSAVDYISLYEKYGHEYLTGKAYEKTKQVAQANFDVEEYIKARTGMDADDNGRLSKKEARNRLLEVGYTEKEIPILMEIINETW